MAINIIELKLHKQPPKRLVRKQTINILKIPFKNKEVGLFSLSKFFNHKSTISPIPKELPNFEIPSVRLFESLFTYWKNSFLTGDTRIINNKKLRKVFTKGPKYRERLSINFK